MQVKVGIPHAPSPTAEILCMKDKSLTAQTHNMLVGQYVMHREPHDGRWYPATGTQHLLEKRTYINKTNENVMYRKTQAHLKHYKPKRNITKNITKPECNQANNNQ